jgi:hypothetical protein
MNDPNDIQLFLFGAFGTGKQDYPESDTTLQPSDKNAQGASPGRALAGRGPSGMLGFIR